MTAAIAHAVGRSRSPNDGRSRENVQRTAEDWDYSRGTIAELIERDRPLTFLDVGCANGLLMESVARWCPNVEPYGLEISPELAARARQRLPQWSERIFVGNAASWQSPRRFDIVRTGLEYVPPPKRRKLVEHLLAMTELLIVGKYNEEIADHAVERELRAWGFHIACAVERPHRSDARLYYRAVGIRGAIA